MTADLQRINHMYQYSLANYLRLFEEALDHDIGDFAMPSPSSLDVGSSKSSEGTEIEKRLKDLMFLFRSLVVEYVARSLFKADRAVFGVHLTRGLHPEQCPPEEWEFFTTFHILQVTLVSIWW